jgi:hypothetical protein
MLPRDPSGLSQIARLAATSPVLAVADPRQQAFGRALASQLGQTLQAAVLARLDDGTFLVRVADMTARMPLPAGLEAGAQLPLTLVALQPRPTFQVGTTQGAPVFAEAAPAPPEGRPDEAVAGAPLAYLEGAPAAALARNAALLAPARTMARLPGQGSAEGAQTSLSPTGRAIADVLAAARKAENPASAAIARTPLLPGPTQQPGPIAAALQHGMEHSGLFYESHVAEWAAGARPLSDLAAEPQAKGEMRTMLEPDTAQFINLQLATHEQARAAWQGPLMPGQDLRWEIERRPAHDDADDGKDGTADDGAGIQWHSRLRLRFGALGEVDARIVLSGDRIHLRLDAGSGVRTLLQAEQTRLADALAAAGTPLATLAIHDHEPS